MALAQQLSETTVLSPRAREHAKSAQARAEDVIYTLNHTFTCLTLTDLVIMPALRGLGLNIGHSHGKQDGHDHHDHHHEPVSAKLPFWRRAGHWAVGEAIGDVGAALVTIPVQRFFPGFMDGMRRVMEPLVGGFFQRGSQRAAQHWADRHGLPHGDQDVVARAQELYDYEMRHLPQMAVWTLTSIGLHYAAMKGMERHITVGEFARMKAAGAGITALMVFGARAAAPDKAHHWDETAGRHVVVPLTKAVGKLFGVRARDVDDYHARQNGDVAPAGWAARVRGQAVSQAEAVRGT